MTAVAQRTFGSGPVETQAANRFIRWSLGVHVTVVALLLIVPRSWFSSRTERPTVMTITLAGTLGPRTTGMTAMGGRTVEQVAPPPKRPEPERPAPPKPDAPAAAIRTPPRPVPQPAAAEIRSTPPSRVPTSGSQVTTGSTAVDTGARSQSLGLTQGGGGTGGDADLVNFCCPEYLDRLIATIESNWQKPPQERGATVLKFTINRDGSITNIVMEQSSGSGVLDRISRNALSDSRLPRLPPEYTRPTLTIHLTFPYGSQ